MREMFSKAGLFHTVWGAVAVVVLVVAGSIGARAQVELPGELPGQHRDYGNCDVDTNGCTGWSPVLDEIYLAEYPDCPVRVLYYKSECPPKAPAIYHGETKYELKWILWPTPDVWDPDSSECYTIHSDYNQAYDKETFLRDLLRESLEVITVKDFTEIRNTDYNEMVADPTPQKVARYEELLCGTGVKSYRGIHGSCMAAHRRPEYVFPPLGGVTEKKGGASVQNGYPDSQTNFLRVRYVPCGGAGMCCIQEIEHCYDPVAEKIVTQIVSTQYGPPSECEEAVPLQGPYLNEEPGMCTDYCYDGTPTNGTVEEGGPDLAKR